MFVRMDTLTRTARDAAYSVPAPAVYHNSSIEWCLAVCEQMRAPVILRCREDRGDYLEFADFARFYEKRHMRVPVALVWECNSLEAAAAAIIAGYTGVSVDLSREVSAEAARRTKEISRMAHAMGAGVEGAFAESESEAQMEAAVRFCQDTDIDVLRADTTMDAASIAQWKASLPAALAMREEIPSCGTAEAAKAGASKWDIFPTLSKGAMERAEQVMGMAGDDRRRLFLLDNEVEAGYKKRLEQLILALDCRNRW